MYNIKSLLLSIVNLKRNFQYHDTNYRSYSLVPNKRGGRLLIFGNFSYPHGPYLDPLLINLGKFLFQQLQDI